MDNLVDLATEIKEVEVTPVEAQKEPSISYPYGLEITFEQDTLKKLGVTVDSFSIGDVISLIAKAKVVSISSSQYEEGPASQSVRLQITSLALDTPAESFEDSFDEAIKKDKKIYPDLQLQTSGGFKKALYEASR